MLDKFKCAWDLFCKKENLKALVLFWDVVDNSEDSILVDKALDIICKIYLMERDRPGLEKAIIRGGNLDYFKLAIEFYDGNHKSAWEIISQLGTYNRTVNGFYGVGLNSLLKDQHWFGAMSNNQVKISNSEFFSIDTSDDSEFVILFAADSNYFKRFYQYPLLSLDVVANAKFHFHVINPDEEDMEILKSIKSKQVNYSFELVDVSFANKAYFASSRFIIAPKLMSLYGKSLFIFDIDSKIVKDLNELFVSYGWSKHNLSLRVSPAIELPWQKIVANALYIPFNDLGLEYIARVRKYLLMAFNQYSDRELWWIDQNAVFFAYESYKGELNYQRWTGLIDKFLKYPKLFENKDVSMKTL